MTYESKDELFRRKEREFAEGRSRDPKAVMYHGPHAHVAGGLPCIYDPCSMLPRYETDDEWGGEAGASDELDELIADHENAGHLAKFDECYPCQRTPSRVRGDR